MKEIKAVKTFNSEKIENVIAASAKGYPFPKNLDNLSPEDILYTPSQQDILRCAIDENWEISRLVDRLKEAH